MQTMSFSIVMIRAESRTSEIESNQMQKNSCLNTTYDFVVSQRMQTLVVPSLTHPAYLVTEEESEHSIGWCQQS